MTINCHIRCKSSKFILMRKIAAQLLFTGAEFIRNGILTLDDEGRVIELSSLGETVVEQQSTEFYNGILCPGFVNAHCHLELSYMRGLLPDGAGMAAFCRGIIALRGSKSADEQLASVSEWDRRMSAEGIVAAGDVSNTEMSLEIKRGSEIRYHTFVECLGLDAARADEAVNKALAVQLRAGEMGLRASITPHSPYSMSNRLFAEAVRRGIERGILSIHNQESADESYFFKYKSGKMCDLFGEAANEFIYQYDESLHRVFDQIDNKTRLLLVHNVYTSPADYEYACSRNGNLVWVLCPASNIYIEKRLPDVNLFVSRDAQIAIGTDSLASNSALSIIQELRILDTNFPKIGLARLLRWATLNGAAALHLDNEFGSFKPGTRPGVVLISGIDFVNRRLTEKSQATRLF